MRVNFFCWLLLAITLLINLYLVYFLLSKLAQLFNQKTLTANSKKENDNPKFVFINDERSSKGLKPKTISDVRLTTYASTSSKILDETISTKTFDYMVTDAPIQITPIHLTTTETQSTKAENQIETQSKIVSKKIPQQRVYNFRHLIRNENSKILNDEPKVISAQINAMEDTTKETQMFLSTQTPFQSGTPTISPVEESTVTIATATSPNIGKIFVSKTSKRPAFQSSFDRRKKILASHNRKKLPAEGQKIKQSETMNPKIQVKNHVYQKTRTTGSIRDHLLSSSILEEQKDDSSTTVVTALLDIGRDKWAFYGRALDKYHSYMENLLRLQIPMVIYVDDRSFEFVLAKRKSLGFDDITKIHKISVERLPLYMYHQQIEQIMGHELNTSNGWKSSWDESMKTHPEVCSSKYDLVVNSKSFFLHETSKENVFDTKFFVWLDAGYGHGNIDYFPINFQWSPFFRPGKISLIKLTPFSDKLSRYNLENLYRQDIAVVSGGFIAGDSKTLARFYHLYYWEFVRLVNDRVIDDDQTVLVLLINQHPELFEIVHGDWFDAFTLF